MTQILERWSTCSTTFSSTSRSRRAFLSGRARSSASWRSAQSLMFCSQRLMSPKSWCERAASNPAAAVVAADDDVLYPQALHRVADHGEHVEVGVDHLVPDVAVHEEVAGLRARHRLGRHPAVRTADPDVAGLLDVLQTREVARVLLEPLLDPARVSLEEPLVAFRPHALFVAAGRLGGHRPASVRENALRARGDPPKGPARKRTVWRLRRSASPFSGASIPSRGSSGPPGGPMLSGPPRSPNGHGGPVERRVARASSTSSTAVRRAP